VEENQNGLKFNVTSRFLVMINYWVSDHQTEGVDRTVSTCARARLCV